MNPTEKIEMRLSILEFEKVKVEMKNKKIKPFAANVGEFDFKEEDSKITFLRCDLTEELPNDTDDQKQSSYTTYIKNIKSVERIREI